MTNAEAAALFASLPPNERAKILVVSGSTFAAEEAHLDEPGANLEEVEEDSLPKGFEILPTIYLTW